VEDRREIQGQALAALGAAGLTLSLWLPWYRFPWGRPTAWEAFSATPTVLLVIAIITGGVAALALAGRAADVAPLLMLAAGVAALLIAYRIAAPPGPGGLAADRWGVWIALVSSLTVLGGAMISRGSTGTVATGAGVAWEW